MASPSDENYEFYKECLKIHGYEFSDSENETENSKFDETYFKHKPPPIPYSSMMDKIVKVQHYQTPIQKTTDITAIVEGLRHTSIQVNKRKSSYAFVAKSELNSLKFAESSKMAFNKQERMLQNYNKFNLNESLDDISVTTCTATTSKNQDMRIYQQQTVTLKPSTSRDITSLEKNKILKSETRQIQKKGAYVQKVDVTTLNYKYEQAYQQQRVMSKSNTNYVVKHLEKNRNRQMYPRDVNMQNEDITTLRDQFRGTYQQQAIMSVPSINFDVEPPKNSIRNKENKQAYQRGLHVQKEDPKLLQNDGIPRNQYNAINQQSSRMTEPDTDEDNNTILRICCLGCFRCC